MITFLSFLSGSRHHNQSSSFSQEESDSEPTIETIRHKERHMGGGSYSSSYSSHLSICSALKGNSIYQWWDMPKVAFARRSCGIGKKTREPDQPVEGISIWLAPALSSVVFTPSSIILPALSNSTLQVALAIRANWQFQGITHILTLSPMTAS